VAAGAPFADVADADASAGPRKRQGGSSGSATAKRPRKAAGGPRVVTAVMEAPQPDDGSRHRGRRGFCGAAANCPPSATSKKGSRGARARASAAEEHNQ